MPEPTVQHHVCNRPHETWGDVARHVWPKAQIWGANGPYATVAPCRSLTVELHLDLPSAELVFAALDGSCGGQCNARSHRLVQLTTPNAPAATTMPPWCGECDGPTLPQRWIYFEQDGRQVTARCPRCNPHAKKR